MTKISTYNLDEKITALDKWIGSDVNQQNRTKNFTPKKLAEYFNEDQIINIGVPLQYKYYTLDPGEQRPRGTLSFETEVGQNVNFSSITTFLLSKYTEKQNIVSDFLNFLNGSKVLLFKSNDINSFGFYRISSLEPYEPDPNFYVVTVDYETGNGFMQEDNDYMLSLVSLPGGAIPTKTSELINDGDDGINPFISEEDINRTEWDAAYDGKINSAEVTGTTTKTLTLTKQDGGTIEASWTDDNTDAVTSVFGRTGDVTAQSGDYNTGQITEVTDKKYQTDNQALFNDATSSIQTQLNNKANDNNVVHKTGNESILGLKSFTQTSINRSGLLLDNSSDLYNSIKIYNRGLNDGIEIDNTSQGGGILVANTGGFSSRAIYLTNTSEGNALIINNSGTGTDNAGNGIYALNSNSGAMFRGVNTSSGPSIILESSLSSTGTPFEITRNGSSQLKINNIGEVTANKFIKLGGTSLQYLMADGTVSTGPVLTGYVPYSGATGNINLGEYGLTSGYYKFDLTPTGTPTSLGTMYWDSFYRTVSLIDGDGDTTLQIGQEERVLVHNNTGSTLTDGQVVYVTGSTGELPSVSLASNTSEATSSVTFGVVTETILNGADGFITTSGIIHGLNTLSYDEGSAIWLGSTPGTFTQTKPVAPLNSVLVGYIIKKSGGNGSIFVKIQNGYELEELHDVLISNVSGNEILAYEGSPTNLWKNKSVIDVLGFTPYNSTNPSNYISLTALSSTATGLSYNNTNGVFSLTSGYVIPTTTEESNWNTAYSNRITSASLPLSISSNSISISQATSTTNGYLTSSDWNTFNNKQVAGNYITALTGEATASGPGSASITLSNSAVTGKLLTGVNITGGTVVDTDSILTAFGKLQNQINGLIGGSIYQGTWNASTNTPSLSSGVGTKGYYYIVNVAGSTNLDGITDWNVGDWAIYDGTAWQQVDNTDAVVSVNGFTGAVSLTTSNISEGVNLYYTESRVSSNADVAANTAARHNAVTIGTANGLSLSTQVLSLGLASSSTNGALSSTDWNTFNNKQNALSGTGFVKISGTTITYDNTTYYPASNPSGYTTNTGTVTSVSGTGGYGGLTLSGSVTTSGSLTLGGTPTGTWPISVSGNANTATNANYANASGVSDTTLAVSGTINYIPKFTSGNILGNSLIYDNGTNVGIGTTAPNQKLAVVALNSTPTLAGNEGTFSVLQGNADYGIVMGTKSSGNGWVQVKRVDGIATAYNLELQPLGGNVGIGTTTVPNTLSVGMASSTTGKGISLTSSAGIEYARFGVINSTVDNTSFIGSISNNNFAIYANNAERMRISQTGNVGIGTTSGITGKLTISSSSGDQIKLDRTGQTSRGIVISGSDNLSIGTWADPTQISITPSGNVGIGTTSIDATYLPKLHIESSASDGTGGLLIGNYLPTITLKDYSGGSTVSQIQQDGSNLFIKNNGNSITLSSSGNVGIGTTSPSGKLTVNGGAIRIESATGISSYIHYISPGNDEWSAGMDGSYNFQIAYSNGLGTPKMTLLKGGNVGIGTTAPSEKLEIQNGAAGAKIKVSNSGGGYATLECSSNATSVAQLSFTNQLSLIGGNVGIGTTAPDRPLSIFNTNTAVSYQMSIGYNSSYKYDIGRDDSNGALKFYGVQSGYCGYIFDSVDGERMRITSTGNVGIGTTTPSTKLDVVGAITASGGFFNSDIRLKELVDYKYSVADIKPITYLWKDGRDSQKHVGYSAQEVQKVMPDAVNEGNDGMLSVNYVEVLVAKIAELENRIKLLENGLE